MASADEDYTPAIIATLVWLGVGVALDVYLIWTRRQRLISDVFRTKLGKMVLALFCIHIIDKFGRVDPFHIAGARIESWSIRPAAVNVSASLTEVTPIAR